MGKHRIERNLYPYIYVTKHMSTSNKEPDRPTLSLPEIEITPAMIEAGLGVYYAWYEGKNIGPFPSEAKFVEALYRAMAAKCDRGSQP
jgi:hypothetical protein